MNGGNELAELLKAKILGATQDKALTLQDILRRQSCPSVATQICYSQYVSVTALFENSEAQKNQRWLEIFLAKSYILTQDQNRWDRSPILGMTLNTKVLFNGKVLNQVIIILFFEMAQKIQCASSYLLTVLSSFARFISQG